MASGEYPPLATSTSVNNCYLQGCPGELCSVSSQFPVLIQWRTVMLLELRGIYRWISPGWGWGKAGIMKPRREAYLRSSTRASGTPYLRKFSNPSIREILVITSDRPSTPQAYQCKITHSPFYSYRWKQGWSWPFFDTTLPALLCKSCHSYAN